MSDDAHRPVKATFVRDVLSHPEHLHPNSPAYHAGRGGFRQPGPLTGREHRSYHAGPGPLGGGRMEEEWRPPLGPFQQCVEIDRPLGGLTNLEFRYAVVRKCLGESASVADIEAGIGRMPWYSVKAFAGRDAYLVVAPAHLHSGGREAPAGSRIPALRGGPIAERFEHVVRLCFDRHLGPELRAQAGQLLTPYNLSLMAAFLAAFALAQGTPVGIVITGAAIGMLGFEALQVLDDFKNFVVKTGFPDETGDFDEAARSLAQVIGRIGIDATLAILTRGAVRRPSPTQAPPSEPMGPSTAQTPSMVRGRSPRAEPKSPSGPQPKATEPKPEVKPSVKFGKRGIYTEPGAQPPTAQLRREIDAASARAHLPPPERAGWPKISSDDAATFKAPPEPVELPEGTRIYRVIDEKSNPNGPYWTLSDPKTMSEVQWRSGAAVKGEWNGDGAFVEYEVPKGGMRAWSGEAAPQMSSDGVNMLSGGGNQVWVPAGSTNASAPISTGWSR